MPDVPTVRIDRSLRRSLAMFGEDRLGWLDRAAALGPLSGLRFGPATVFVVTDAELARAVLVTDRAWTRPPSQRVPVAVAVGENLFSASERAWARVQPTLAPAFRRRALAAPLAGLGDILAEQVDAIPVGEELDLGAVMARLAFVAAAWVMLGDRLDAERADELLAHQRCVVDWVGERLGALQSAIPIAVGSSAREMRAHRRALEAYVDDAVDRAERAGELPPILAAAAHAAASSGRRGRVPGSREQLLGLLLAGNETTAAALSWLLVQAAAHPATWTRVATEPERVRGFVAETLRLSPPAWGVTRTPTRRPVQLAAAGASVRVRRPARGHDLPARHPAVGAVLARPTAVRSRPPRGARRTRTRCFRSPWDRVGASGSSSRSRSSRCSRGVSPSVATWSSTPWRRTRALPSARGAPFGAGSSSACRPERCRRASGGAPALGRRCWAAFAMT